MNILYMYLNIFSMYNILVYLASSRYQVTLCLTLASCSSSQNGSCAKKFAHPWCRVIYEFNTNPFHLLLWWARIPVVSASLYENPTWSHAWASHQVATSWRLATTKAPSDFLIHKPGTQFCPRWAGTDQVTSLAFDPANTTEARYWFLWQGPAEESIKIWDVALGACLSTLNECSNFIYGFH